jgi:hypothetical protein
MKTIYFTYLSDKFEVKFNSSQRFLMIDFGTLGMPLRKWWYVFKHFITSLHFRISLHVAASSSSSSVLLNRPYIKIDKIWASCS